MARRLIKEILLDQRSVLEKKRPGTPRDVLAEVDRHMDKPHAITLAGVRRCGKSTLLRQIAERQDLLYRLKVVELHVPSLRERRDDILPLARLLLAEAALRMKRRIAGLAPEVADRLLRYPWPGNVRELENGMERAVALARGSRVEIEDLSEEVRQAMTAPVASAGKLRPLRDVEREYILAALQLNNRNQTQTARHLEIGSATLYRKLKAYGLTGKTP